MKDKGYFSKVNVCRLIWVLTLSLGIELPSCSRYTEDTITKRKMCALLLGRKEESRQFSCICHFLIACSSNDPYAKVAYSGGAYPHPPRFLSTTDQSQHEISKVGKRTSSYIS